MIDKLKNPVFRDLVRIQIGELGKNQKEVEKVLNLTISGGNWSKEANVNDIQALIDN